MVTRLEAIEARSLRVWRGQSKLRWPRPDAEVLTGDDIPLLLAVARAAVEREAAERAYLEAHTNPDVDVLGDAAERLQAAIEALREAIAPLLIEEVTE